MNNIQELRESLTKSRAELDTLINEYQKEQKIIKSTEIDSAVTVLNHLLTNTFKNIKIAPKDIKIVFNRYTVNICLFSNHWQSRHYIELAYIPISSKERYPCIRLSDKNIYKDANPISLECYSLILLDLSREGKLFKLITKCFVKLYTHIKNESSIDKTRNDINNRVNSLTEQLKFVEFKLKLQPEYVITNSNNEHLLIHKITNKTIIISNRTTESNTKYRMFIHKLYEHCNNKWKPWKVLSKTEYIEQVI